MRIVGKLMAVSLCAVLAISMAGCGHKKVHAKSGALVAADPSVKGAVTVYTSTPKAQADRYLAEFQREYPNVTLSVVDGGERVIVVNAPGAAAGTLV